MGLQVRVVHALADRVADLEPRADGAPLVVGRATEADIHIPSLNVSRRHAMLHVRDGGWVLQDGGGGRGTFVNGQPLTGAVKLKSGDVVTLGTDPTPATLVIDPYGEAGGARPAAAAEDPPSTYRSATPATGSALPQPMAVAPVSAPPRSRSRHVTPAVAENDPFAMEPVPADEGDATDEFMAAAATASRAPGRKPPKKQGMSPGLIAATVALTVLIVGGAVLLYVKRSRDAAAIAAATPALTVSAPVKTAAPPRKKTDVFTDTEADRQAQAAGRPLPPAAGSPSNSTGQTVASSGSPPSRSSIDLPPELGGGRASKGAGQPSMDDDGNRPPAKATGTPAERYWAGVEEAHGTSEPVVAVVIYEDYLKLYPDGAHVKEVNQFMDEALDQLWWQRIADLMKKQQELQKEMLKKDSEIAAETSADFKEKLNGEKALLTRDLDTAADELKAMKYDLQDPPNTHDPAALKLLRQGRDAQVFESWKKSVHSRIKTSRGARVF